MSELLDCQRCGACCVNHPDNQTDGYTAYVAVDAGERILRKSDLVERYVNVDHPEGPHLRLAGDGRCAALLGRLGDRVRCAIYFHRPGPCRRVEAGSQACLDYRAAHGVVTSSRFAQPAARPAPPRGSGTGRGKSRR